MLLFPPRSGVRTWLSASTAATADSTARAAYDRNLHELAKRPQVWLKVSEVIRRVDGQVPTDPNFYKPRLAELFPRSISGLGDAIGVNHQKVAGRESDAPGDALPFGKQADHRGRGREPFERAVGAEEQRGVVTAIGVNAGAKIDRVTP